MPAERSSILEKTFSIRGQSPYVIRNPHALETPRLVVFRDRMQSNIRRMEQHLEKVAPGSGFRHLCCHVKTHKSVYVARCMMDSGIASFKCTPNELEMLISAGARDIFVAYPLMQHDAGRIAGAAKAHPECRITVQAGHSLHIKILKEAAAAAGIVLPCMIDVDVGMHRTGAVPDEAFGLYRELSSCGELAFEGLHGYDGHIHEADPVRRLEESKRSMERLIGLARSFRKKDIPVGRIVAAGSITYPEDLELLMRGVDPGTLAQVSPGTWIYWDSEYEGILPGRFEIAALIMAQAVESSEGRVTLNCGHKRWGADRGPVTLFSIEGRVASFSEEHLVLETGSGASCRPGDFVLVAPRHICSTVNLYGHFALIGEAGEILNPAVPIEGRNQ